MTWFSKLSLRIKLMLMLLGVGLGAVTIVGGLGYLNGRSALRQSGLEHLTSLRAAKAYQLQEYFTVAEEQALALADSYSSALALEELLPAYQRLQERRVPQVCVDTLRSFYTTNYLPRIDLGPQDLGDYLPRTVNGQLAQCRYVAEFPGESHLDPDVLADLRAFETAYDRVFTGLDRLSRQFVYYDFLIVDPSGNIVFTLKKEPDLGTNLRSGPYQGTNIARAFESALSTPPNTAVLVDFESYQPSQLWPAGFIAAPRYAGDEVVLVFVAQISLSGIDRIMTGGEHWEYDGLGRTGETYLVGPDATLRSSSRFELEDMDTFLADRERQGASAGLIEQIRHRGTSILLQRVDTDAVKRAQAGETGTEILYDYRHKRVLASFAPLDLEGLDWTIHSEIDLAEADAPIHRFARNLVISASVLSILIIALSMTLADRVMRPIQALITATRVVGGGEWDVAVRVYSRDELGELARAFNDMIATLASNSRTIRAQDKKNRRLLEFIRKTFGQYVSEDVANALLESPDRIQLGGETRDVSVLLSDLRGYSTLSENLRPDQVVEFLNEYLSGMNEVIDRHRGVVIEYLGDAILASFGAPNDMPNHAEVALRCAIEMRERLQELNQEWEEDGFAQLYKAQGIDSVVQRVGLHSGPVVAGNLGSKTRMKYAITGDTVNVAARLEAANKDTNTTILASMALYDRLPADLRARGHDHGEIEVKGRAEKVHVFSF